MKKTPTIVSTGYHGITEFDLEYGGFQILVFRNYSAVCLI